MNILVIEDQPIDAKLAQALLSYEGHMVHEVKTAEQAIPVIRRSKPDLIILDLSLPGMDGLTLARELKQRHETHDIVIIAITAFTNRWSRRKALEAGCDSYFTKPFDTRLLCAQVAELAQNLG